MEPVPPSKADHNDRPNYRLSFLTIMTSFVALFLAATLSLWLWPWTASAAGCSSDPTRFTLSDLPYINYFYSDCHSAAQVIVRSPLPGSLLDIVTPRLLVCSRDVLPPHVHCKLTEHLHRSHGLLETAVLLLSLSLRMVSRARWPWLSSIRQPRETRWSPSTNPLTITRS